ncbi:BGTF surface domain-containing protein [Halonotius pteroides]
MVAASAAFAGAAAAQEASISTSTDANLDNVSPGDTFDIDVTVENTGSSDATVVDVRVQDEPSGVTAEDAGLGLDAPAPGESATKTVSVTVGDDVASGDYSVDIFADLGNEATSTTPVEFTVSDSDTGDGDTGDGDTGDSSSVTPAIPDGEYDDDIADVEATPADLDGTAYYQGQELDVTLTGEAGSSVQLRNVQSFGAEDGNTQLSQQLTVNDNDVVNIDTEDLSSGDYFLTGVPSLPSTQDILARNDDTFSVNEQSLTAEFDVDDRTNDGVNSIDTDFEFDSNRGSYPITIHAQGDLDTEDLTNIFVAPNDNVDLAYTREDDDGETDFDEIGIVRDNSGVTEQADLADAGITDDDTYNADFDGIDAESYEFTFTGTDSTAVATDSIEVTEANEAVDFVGGVDQSAAGDIAEFNFTIEDTDDTYLQFGDEESDFVDVMYVEVDDEDEPVNIEINTRLLGTSAGVNDVYDTDNVDTFESEVHSDNGVETHPAVGLYDDDGTPIGDNGNDFTQYLDELEIIDASAGEGPTDQLIRPLQPTDYSVIAAGTTSVDDGVFDADPGGEANDELGSKVLELTQPEIGDITVHKAPEEDADDEDNVADLVEKATPSTDIAIDDQTIIQVEATGIYGSMVAGPDGEGNLNTDFDRLEDGMSSNVLYNIDEEIDTQITFEAEAGDATGNQGALEVALQGQDNGGSVTDSDVFVVLDEENGQFFVVVDTSSDDAFVNGDAPDEETTFDVLMEYDADNEDDRFEFADSKDPYSFQGNSFQNYPYLQQGETISNSANFELSPRSIVFDNLNSDQVVEAAASDSAEISGSTNVAPGSDATLRVASTNASSSFRIGNDLNVTEDGSVTTTFDLSDQEVGDEFELVYQVAGSSTDTADGVIVESVDTGEDEPADEDEGTNETADDGEDMDDGESEPADDGETNESTDGGSADDGGSTDDGTPGFGAVVALVALIGAALLAVRRQN